MVSPNITASEQGPAPLHEILLMRHAKSDWPEGVSDLERPLSEKGKKNAVKMGQWLINQGLMPDLILVSPAKRAQQTVRRLCKECKTPIETLDALYNADENTLMQILQNLPENVKRVMIVGHNPGIQQLAETLDEAPPSDPLFPTAAIVHLLFPGKWQQLLPHHSKRLNFVTPKTL